MLYFRRGNENETPGDEDLKNGLFEALKKLESKNKILVLPPDYTRFHFQGYGNLEKINRLTKLIANMDMLDPRKYYNRLKK